MQACLKHQPCFQLQRNKPIQFQLTTTWTGLNNKDDLTYSIIDQPSFEEQQMPVPALNIGALADFSNKQIFRVPSRVNLKEKFKQNKRKISCGDSRKKIISIKENQRIQKD